jgi:hypothetical protein
VHGLSLAFKAREQNRFFTPSIVIIAGVMAMHRWTSVFLVWWTEEDAGFSLKRRRLIVNGHLCFGPWSFVLLQSDPWLKCNWILTFLRYFQVGPWILIFAIWTPIKPQTLIFLQLSPWLN